jgi:hypothetical protein
MKVLKLDDKVKAINIFDGGERCRVVAEEMGDGCTQIMNILLKKGKILTILKTMTYYVLLVIFLPVVLITVVYIYC